MLRSAAALAIQDQCGRRSDLNSTIITQMQYVQATIFEQHHWLPWFLISEMSGTTTAIGERRIQLPTDFLREIDDEPLWLIQADNADVPRFEVPKQANKRTVVRYPTPGKPRFYDVVGEYIYLSPEPDAVYSVEWRYYQADAVLSSDIENNWLKFAPDLMIAETAFIIADKYIHNDVLAARFRNDAVTAWDRLYKANIAREEANRSRNMGEPS